MRLSASRCFPGKTRALAFGIFLAANAWLALDVWAQWENYEPYTFTTLAGSVGAVDGTGSAARFLSLASVAVDNAGVVYVVDNGAVRKVTPDGVVTTLVAVSGEFMGIVGLAVDGTGNLFGAGWSSHTILKRTPAGVVTTLAGVAGSPGSEDGPGSAARFNLPSDVGVDTAGNVYVTDSQNFTIRKITPTGVVTTLAGLAGNWGNVDGTGSAARFGGNSGGPPESPAHGPTGLAVDSSGNVYVMDRFNNTVRKVTPEGVVTTIAGRVGIQGSADGTGSSALFFYPTDVAVDPAGNVSVAEYQSYTIRRITPSGVVTTLAGRAGSSGSTDGTGRAARFSSPENLAADSDGNVYVADGWSAYSIIRKVSPAGVVTTLAGSSSPDGTGPSARFAGPSGVALDPSGNVYVADANHHTIRKVTPAGVVTTLAGLTRSSGTADGMGSVARFNSPSSVALDTAGNLYVADALNVTIRKVTPAGLVTTLAGLAGNYGSEDGTGSTARFAQLQGVAVDAAGNVYVADTLNRTIRNVTPAGVVTTLAGMPGSEGSADGVGNAATFASPSGVAVDAAGNVFVADLGSIRKVTPQGVVTTLAGSGYGSVDGTGPAAKFRGATGLAVDSVGNVYVADSGNHTIRKVTPAGVVTTLGGVPPLFDSDGNLLGGSESKDGTGSEARFASPLGVAVDSAGNLYVADTGNNSVRKGVPGPKFTNSIPDPALRHAVRLALNKPAGELTPADMASLTVLDASRSALESDAPPINSLEGLEEAGQLVELYLWGTTGFWGSQSHPALETGDLRPVAGLTNLTTLDLHDNQFTNLTLPAGLSKLRHLNLSGNRLNSLALPGDLRKLGTLDLGGNQLADFSLPAGLVSLTNLILSSSQLSSLALPSDLSQLVYLSLNGNQLTHVELPSGLENLALLDLSGNQLTNLDLPDDLSSLSTLTLEGNQLRKLTLPTWLTNLSTLNASANRLTDFILPAELTSLTHLVLAGNQLTNLTLPSGLSKLSWLDLSWNRLADLTLPNDLGNLASIQVENNQLTSLTLPSGLTNLAFLQLAANQLTHLELPPDLGSLVSLQLMNNRLTSLTLPPGLTNLSYLQLAGNRLTQLDLPPDLGSLSEVDLTGNNLTSVTLPTALRHLTLNLNGDSEHHGLSFLGGLTNLVSLAFNATVLSPPGSGALMNVTLPGELISLTNLSFLGDQMTSLTLEPGLSNLVTLDLGNNRLTSLTLPPGLSSLAALNLKGHRLTSLTLPAGLSSLKTLALGNRELTNLTLPPDLSSLVDLNLYAGQLTGLTLPSGLNNLLTLDISQGQLTTLSMPPDLGRLTQLTLRSTLLTSLTLPPGLTNLTQLHFDNNQLTSLRLPPDLTNLTELFLAYNHLTSLTLPPGVRQLALALNENPISDYSFLSSLTNLTSLTMSTPQGARMTFPPGLSGLTNLSLHLLAGLTLPPDLVNLVTLDLGWAPYPFGVNFLTELTLPEGLSQLVTLNLRDNPLTNLTLPAGNEQLWPRLEGLRNSGVRLTLLPHLRASHHPANGSFAFTLFANAGKFHVLRSSDLRAWTDLGSVTVTTPNFPGVVFTDPAAPEGPAFYRVGSP